MHGDRESKGEGNYRYEFIQVPLTIQNSLRYVVSYSMNPGYVEADNEKDFCIPKLGFVYV